MTSPNRLLHRAFRDEMEVDQGAVIYIALEGCHGAKNRLAALRKTGKLKADAPFYLIFDHVSLLEEGHSKRLSETVAAVAQESGHPVKLVIIDTMARAMAGGDENSGDHVGAGSAIGLFQGPDSGWGFRFSWSSFSLKINPATLGHCAGLKKARIRSIGFKLPSPSAGFPPACGRVRRRRWIYRRRVHPDHRRGGL